MDDIVLTRTLRQQGYNSDEVRRLAECGELLRLRRGAYARDPTTELSVEQRHRRLTVPLLQDGAVISHASAAVLHGLPVWPSAVSQVHLTRDRLGGGKNRTQVGVHGARLAGDDVTSIDGFAGTSLGRTVLDLCRALPIEQAVAAGDRALATGLWRRCWRSVTPVGPIAWSAVSPTGDLADGCSLRERRRVGEPGPDRLRRAARARAARRHHSPGQQIRRSRGLPVEGAADRGGVRREDQVRAAC